MSLFFRGYAKELTFVSNVEIFNSFSKILIHKALN